MWTRVADRWRVGVVLAATGVVLGVGVALLAHVIGSPDASEDEIYYGRYVPLQGVEMSKQYSSTLTITTDSGAEDWLPPLVLGAGIGLAVGLVCWVLLLATRRRIALVRI